MPRREIKNGYVQQRSGDVIVMPDDEAFRFACCDCSLVHDLRTTVDDDGNVLMQVTGNDAETARLRALAVRDIMFEAPVPNTYKPFVTFIDTVTSTRRGPHPCLHETVFFPHHGAASRSPSMSTIRLLTTNAASSRTATESAFRYR